MNRLASTSFFAQLALALLLLTVGTALNFATQSFSSLLFAHQQTHYDNLARGAQIIARTLVTVVLLQAGWKVLALAVASLVSVGLFSLLAEVRACLRLALRAPAHLGGQER